MARGDPLPGNLRDILTGHHTEAKVFRTYGDALRAAEGLGILASPSQNLSKDGWTVYVPFNGDPYYYRGGRRAGKNPKKRATQGRRRRTPTRAPKKSRRNPGGDVSESQAWKFVKDAATAIRRAKFGYPASKVVVDTKDLALGLYRLALQMGGQVKRGLHTNPALAVLGNPGGGVAGTIAEQLYEIRYRHAQDHKNYKHPFQKGVRVTLLKDGRAVIWHPSKPVWEDFPE